jgi:carbohydrate-binding DOMON domain-containing protein
MCCGRTPRSANQQERAQGSIASAETFIASAKPRYLVVARQAATTGKTFSTLTAAQDYARRSGGIVRQL